MHYNLKLQDIFENILSNLEESDFKGIDPYDSANSDFSSPFLKNPYITFLNKLSPLNFRKILRIAPSFNSKAIAIILNSLTLYDYHKHKKIINLLYNWLVQNKSQQFDEYSLGFAFDIIMSQYKSGSNKTSLIISLFVMFAFIDLFNQNKDEDILDNIRSFKKLLETKWPSFESKNELWFSYLFEKKVEVYNATAKVGKFYAKLLEVDHDEDVYEKMIKISSYLYRAQRKDGSWPYSTKNFYSDNFHTAFILESIFEMNKHLDIPKFDEMLKKGTENYHNSFFKKNRTYHFHNQYSSSNVLRKLLGVEIRDFANAIILFSKTGQKSIAEDLLNQALNNLFDNKNNYFYFYKNQIFTNKIEYIRWQAWMMLAISIFEKK